MISRTVLIVALVSVAKCDVLQGIIPDPEGVHDDYVDGIDDSVLSDTLTLELDGEGVGSSAGGIDNGHDLFPNGTNTECDDIAIIGAGIAGSFTAWRLRHSNLSISVYEYANRIGGRIYTSHIHGVKGFHAELGAMRFHIPSHPHLNQVINELGLTIVPFTQGYGATNHTSMYLRGVHLRYDQLGKSLETPYHLKPSERVSYDQLRWEIFINNTDYLQFPNKSYFYLETKDGIPLYQQSIQAVFAKYLSTELVQYIKDVNSFLSDFGTTNAAYALPARDPITPGESSLKMSTVKQGMDTIPKRMIQQFQNASSRHHVFLKHHLLSIKKQNDVYNLHFDQDINHAVKDKCAKKVILAITRAGLEKLEWDVLKRRHVNDLITKSVRDAHAVKFFLAYDYAWWRNSKYYDVFAISDTPIHRTYDFGTIHGSNISVLDAVYSDNDVSLWEELVKRGPKLHGNSMHTVTNETIHIIHKYLAAIYGYPFENIPRPIGGVIGVWSSYPIGGAWQEWLPGYVMTDVERQMIQPSLADHVYVASNAFNSKSLSFWSESSLEASEAVLQKFNMPSYLSN